MIISEIGASSWYFLVIFFSHLKTLLSLKGTLDWVLQKIICKFNPNVFVNKF